MQPVVPPASPRLADNLPEALRAGDGYTRPLASSSMFVHTPPGYADRPALPSVYLHASGDGHGGSNAPAFVTVPSAPTYPTSAYAVPQASNGPTRPENWKLVGLVVTFLVWVAGAAVLLFSYMDRYMFP